MTLANQLTQAVKSFSGVFNMKSLYERFPEEKPSTIRGRVYDSLLGKGVIEKVGKGLYTFKGENGSEGVILNGDARTLDCLTDKSIELIIADHPYPIVQGTNRSYNDSYVASTFEYTSDDFTQKARVLKDGGFLVEFLPELKETNIDYMCRVIKMAQDAGFNFYCKIPWYKAEIRNGKLVDGSAFVGRKAVLEEIYIFSKGKPRSLRYRQQGETMRLERGASVMFPAVFMEPTLIPSKRVHKAQKPSSLLKKLIEALSLEGEFVLDQFAGSFATFFSALELKRKAIAIEIDEEFIENIK